MTEEKQLSYQVYQPPYFFQAARPTIDSVASGWDYNQTYSLTYTAGGNITKVRLIRTGAATHSFDQNQRSMELESISEIGGNTILIKSPQHPDAAPP